MNNKLQYKVQRQQKFSNHLPKASLKNKSGKKPDSKRNLSVGKTKKSEQLLGNLRCTELIVMNGIADA